MYLFFRTFLTFILGRAGAKEAGIEEGRNNNVGKNETQNRVSEIGTGGKQLKRRSAHLTEISGIKAGMCYVEI